ncbi:MAG: phosphopantothenoylcysteine decarboxylase/phosphopantothenate--cysteine ligase [Actinomycetes bacterium]
MRVVPTEAALQFVGRATWEALSGNPVTTTVFDNVDEVAHVRIAQNAKLVVVAPATADLLSRMAAGRADDLLTSTLLMATSPVIAVPAMHSEMWRHLATTANVETLRGRGIRVIEPADGRLTGADSGPGRLPEASAIAEVCEAVLARDAATHDLSAVRIVISAGGTREPIDPVRYLGNRSSGRQGWALAAAAVARGAAVEVVAANVDSADPAGATVTRVKTSEDLHKVMVERSREADVVIMAAAIADFRTQDVAAKKIKKSDSGEGVTLDLERTTDVLAELGASRLDGRPILVGFAAETEPDETSRIDLARGKLKAKGADLIVANEVGTDRGFEESGNQVAIVSAEGVVGRTGRTSKFGVANEVLDAVSDLL